MAESGRYKSRLLNYLVEQSHKLSEQAGHRLRQARIGVVWGAQVLLYPLYVAFQTSRVVGRRLSQGGPMPGQARLTPPRADDVISSVLKLARNLADEGAITIGADQSPIEQKLPATVGAIAAKIPVTAPATASVTQPEIYVEAQSNQVSSQASGAGNSIGVAIAPNPTKASLKSASPAGANLSLGGVDIRGVASELGNRALVLVDNSNRIVPLESEQQWSLQQTIVQQVADFNYRRKRYSHQLALVEAGGSQGLLGDRPLPLPRPRAKQLAGFRWMTHLMGWMQTSNLAQSTNLFKESQLANQLAAQVAAPPFLYWDPEPGQQLTRQTLAQLDSPLAGLEQRYIQRHERDDAGTKALRFTAKLFGLEEAADQWLRASAAAKAAENASTPQQTANGHLGLSPELEAGQVPNSQVPDSQVLGAMQATWTSVDPWGDYTGQLPGKAPQGMEPLQPPAEKSPIPGNLPPGNPQTPLPNPQGQGWLSGLLNPGRSTSPTEAGMSPVGHQPPNPATHPSHGNSAPKGWQRLTTRFSGLLRNLKQPAGPIAPLKPQGSQPFTPPATAPTNDNIGLGKHGPNSDRQDATPLGNLAQSGISDPQIEAAWQKRIAKAKTKAGEPQSENVTLRSPLEGAQPVATSTREQATENPAESAAPNALQTTENSVTYESPYIETTAQFNGYERHPLEVILDQLDRILLWIEELGLRLWRWLTNAGEQ